MKKAVSLVLVLSMLMTLVTFVPTSVSAANLTNLTQGDFALTWAISGYGSSPHLTTDGDTTTSWDASNRAVDVTQDLRMAPFGLDGDDDAQYYNKAVVRVRQFNTKKWTLSTSNSITNEEYADNGPISAANCPALEGATTRFTKTFNNPNHGEKTPTDSSHITSDSTTQVLSFDRTNDRFIQFQNTVAYESSSSTSSTGPWSFRVYEFELYYAVPSTITTSLADKYTVSTGTVQPKATVKDADGDVILDSYMNQFKWTVSAPQGGVSIDQTTGLITFDNPASQTITVTCASAVSGYTSVKATKSIQITSTDLKEVLIEGAPTNVVVPSPNTTAKYQLNVTPYKADGSVASNYTDFTWTLAAANETSSKAGISVSSTGLLTVTDQAQEGSVITVKAACAEEGLESFADTITIGVGSGYNLMNNANAKAWVKQGWGSAPQSSIDGSATSHWDAANHTGTAVVNYKIDNNAREFNRLVFYPRHNNNTEKTVISISDTLDGTEPETSGGFATTVELSNSTPIITKLPSEIVAENKIDFSAPQKAKYIDLRNDLLGNSGSGYASYCLREFKLYNIALGDVKINGFNRLYAVPTASTTITPSLAFKNTLGEAVENPAGTGTWSISGNTTGVTFNSSTGAVTIGTNAVEQTFTVKYTFVADGITLAASYPVRIGLASYKKPSGSTIISSMTSSHPRILINSSEMTTLINKIKAGTDPNLNYWWLSVKSKADGYMGTSAKARVISGGRMLDSARELKGRIVCTAMAWLVTRETKYKDKCVQELTNAASTWTDWNPSHFLDTAETMLAVSMGYDWLYNDLTSSQRTTIRNGIINKGLAQHTSAINNGHSWTNANHNWNAICNGGAIVAAIAVGSDYSSSATVINNALNNIEKSLINGVFAQSNGGYQEGPLYWRFTTEFVASVISSIQAATGKTYGFERIQGMDKIGYFGHGIKGYRQRVFNFGDSLQRWENDPQTFYFAKLMGDDQLTATRIWDMAEVDKPAEGRDLIWYTPMVENVSIDDELDFYSGKQTVNGTGYTGVQVATFRSSYEDCENAIFAGIKGNVPGVNHAHLDAGTFIIDAWDARWIAELGRDNNAYDFSNPLPARSFYRGRAEGHNTLVINGRNTTARDQNESTSSQITERVSYPRGGYAKVNLTNAYNHTTISDARRGLWLIDRSQVLVRDEVKLTASSTVDWYAHTPANVTLKNSNKTAIFTQVDQDGDTRYFRADIVAGSGSFEFIAASSTNSTINGNSSSNAPHDEVEGTTYKKLAIKRSGVTGTYTNAVLFTPISTPDEAITIPDEAYLALADWKVPVGDPIKTVAVDPVVWVKEGYGNSSPALVDGNTGTHWDASRRAADAETGFMMRVAPEGVEVPKYNAFKVTVRHFNSKKWVVYGSNEITSFAPAESGQLSNTGELVNPVKIAEYTFSSPTKDTGGIVEIPLDKVYNYRYLNFVNTVAYQSTTEGASDYSKTFRVAEFEPCFSGPVIERTDTNAFRVYSNATDLSGRVYIAAYDEDGKIVAINKDDAGNYAKIDTQNTSAAYIKGFWWGDQQLPLGDMVDSEY